MALARVLAQGDVQVFFPTVEGIARMKSFHARQTNLIRGERSAEQLATTREAWAIEKLCAVKAQASRGFERRASLSSDKPCQYIAADAAVRQATQGLPYGWWLELPDPLF